MILESSRSELIAPIKALNLRKLFTALLVIVEYMIQILHCPK